MRSFIFLILIFLFGCTNGVPNVSKIYQESGLSISKNDFNINNLISFQVSGICNSKYESILVKINEKSWENISEILDLEKTNDIDCSNQDFSFYIDPKKAGILFGDSAILSIKQIDSKNEETNISQIKITYPNYLKAETTAPLKTGKSLSLPISGNGSYFRYKVGKTDCKNFDGYSSSLENGILNLDLSSLSEGEISLCLLAESPEGLQSLKNPTIYNMFLDKTAPTLIEIKDKPEEFDNKDNFSITIIADSALKYGIKKVMNSDDCNNGIGFTEKPIETQYSLSVPDSDKNQVNFLCLYLEDEFKNRSSITTYSWTHDNINPPTFTGNLSKSLSNNNQETPDILLNKPSNLGSPYSKWKLKIAKDIPSNTIIDWTDFNYSESLLKITSLNLEDGTYKVYVKLVDQANNESSVVHIGDWISDTSPPIVNHTTYPSLHDNRRSKSFKYSFSDLSGIFSARAWLLDEDNNVYSGPIDITNNTEFYFSTDIVPNKHYTLKVVVVDFAGNSKIDGENYTSENCVSTNPNNVYSSMNICSDLTESEVIGWKMQGGIVIGKENSSFFVSPENIAGESANLPWGSGISGVFENTTLGDSVNPFPTSINSVSNNFCKTKNINTFSDWYLPRKTEMIRVLCASGFLCPVTPVITLPASQEFWTISEKNSLQSIFFDFNISNFNFANKTDSKQVICVRKF